ncbi:Polyketide cyclase/dehydrase and lipid transport superfamily protein [Striga hermonthica]|uniref:Polyketide cyclase/dehydrase and lipid transport superfamily protein n=1 Tax=Striga hermonthica TaxID=68872 RepID=A0A9N7RIS7_STRHE|nr:Polyketide cyclase/dehydrase and lipid transport superfamily protein [Striga hermonthica]
MGHGAWYPTSGGLGSIVTMVQTEDEFWMGNGKLAGNWWPWTWSLTVVLLIFTFRLLTFRFRFSRRRPTVSIPVEPKPDGGLPSPRGPGVISDLDLKNLINELDEKSPENGVVWLPFADKLNLLLFSNQLFETSRRARQITCSGNPLSSLLLFMYENVADKSNNNLISYKAKCCKPKDGPLKYLSVTVFEECSVEQLLQMDGDSGTEFGRMIKKFPLLTPRDYVLAWRIWQGVDGSFYCFCKECGHPLAPHEKRYVRVALFRSGWRIRKVPGRNACEIKMVHQEDAGLNVEMAKVAFAKGIWNYVRKMDDALRKYSAGRQHLLEYKL